MQGQPCVYTLDMKSMIAPRKNPYILALHKLPQTYGAVGCRRNTEYPRLVNHGRNLNHHQLCLLLHEITARRQTICRRHGRHLISGGLVDPRARSAPHRATDDRVQPERAYQRAEQSRQDYDHVAVEVRGVVVFVRDVRAIGDVGVEQHTRQAVVLMNRHCISRTRIYIKYNEQRLY
ncbi:hypothetical protein MIMGU_mgv1a014852mg [Erythranthe guttata]|uniref:Uncharacterized protein n=1 Tax=Erythranthe guttata TaxID=4155 RepID=A0A022RB02_ERYGU|nr:hypothetical protein MIMGU_mgv1a014852mg [Erythranthe guttata]